MSKKKKLILSIGLCFVLLVIIVLATNGQDSIFKLTNSSNKDNVTENTQNSNGDKDSENNDNEDSDNSDSENSGEEQTSAQKKDLSKIVIGPIIQDPSSLPDDYVFENPAPELEKISFPYTIPGSKITVEGIQSYSGIFIEDGSDRDVNDISVLFLTNNGDEDVEFAEVNLITADNETLNFRASGLSAGTTIAVQESSAHSYLPGPFVAVDSQASDEENFSTDDRIEVSTNENGELIVKNVSAEDIPELRVFYKFYYPEVNSYVGGITYNFKVENLKAGEEKTINPSHFDKDASRVVMIRTY